MSTGPITPGVPILAPIFKKSDFEDDHLTLFNQWTSQVAQFLNTLMGHAGPIPLQSDINLSGKRIVNVGPPLTPNDVVNLAYANTNLGPVAIRPHIEALGKSILTSYRRLNDQVQSEQYSTFLNGVLNTAPTSNDATVSFGAPSGGSVAVTISAGRHLRVDGSIAPFASRTDTLALPSAFAITSLTRTSGVVAAVTSVANPLVAGNNFSVLGPADPSFAGTFVVLSVTNPTHFTYQQLGQPDATSGASGTISLGGVYYYSIARGQSVLSLTGPFTQDSWQNRLQGSFDGETLIATAIVNGSGGDTTNSGAGATAPTQGVAGRPVSRL